MSDKYEASKIKQNTLAKEIFRIDYYTIENFDEIIEKINKYLEEHGYSYQ